MLSYCFIKAIIWNILSIALKTPLTRERKLCFSSRNKSCAELTGFIRQFLNTFLIFWIYTRILRFSTQCGMHTVYSFNFLKIASQDIHVRYEKYRRNDLQDTRWIFQKSLEDSYQIFRSVIFIRDDLRFKVCSRDALVSTYRW